MIAIDVNDKKVQQEVADLIRAFRKLPKDLAKKRLKSAIRKATKPFEPTLRSNTPYHTGSLQRSIKTKIKVYDAATHGAVVAVVGYTMGTLRKRRGAFVITGSGHHAIIVERGTTLRRRSNGGACGVMPARRMATKTLDATKGPLLSSLRAELAASLEKTAQELAK